MPPLRIVHALPFFDPATRFGGPIAQLRRVCRSLAQRGHRVRVITTDLDIGPGLPREQWVEKDGYKVWYTHAHRLGGCAPYYAPRVRTPLEACLPETDVLHLSLSFTHMNVVARRFAMLRGVPYIYTPRSCLDPVRLGQRKLLKLGFLGLFERRVIRDAAAVHVLTDTELDQVVRQGADRNKCVVIPNAAEFEPDTAFPDGVVFRKHFGIADDTPLVLFLGRLHRIKGIDVLVDAFAMARTDLPDAQLVIAGPDEGEQHAIEQRIRQRGLDRSVHLVGRVDGDLRLAAFRAADVFALTSYSEGMPNAVLEACAAGTPVLISEQCNLPDVTACGAGMVVQTEPGPVAAALKAMLTDPRRLAVMGQRGRQMVHERFSSATVIDRLEQMYEGLAGTAAGVSTAHAA